MPEDLYPIEALRRAAAAYEELCAVTIDRGADGILVSIRPIAGSPPQAALEFWNYALCAAIEQRLGDVG